MLICLFYHTICGMISSTHPINVVSDWRSACSQLFTAIYAIQISHALLVLSASSSFIRRFSYSTVVFNVRVFNFKGLLEICWILFEVGIRMKHMKTEYEHLSIVCSVH